MDAAVRFVDRPGLNATLREAALIVAKACLLVATGYQYPGAGDAACDPIEYTWSATWADDDEQYSSFGAVYVRDVLCGASIETAGAKGAFVVAAACTVLADLLLLGLRVRRAQGRAPSWLPLGTLVLGALSGGMLVLDFGLALYPVFVVPRYDCALELGCDTKSVPINATALGHECVEACVSTHDCSCGLALGDIVYTTPIYCLFSVMVTVVSCLELSSPRSTERLLLAQRRVAEFPDEVVSADDPEDADADPDAEVAVHMLAYKQGSSLRADLEAEIGSYACYGYTRDCAIVALFSTTATALADVISGLAACDDAVVDGTTVSSDSVEDACEPVPSADSLTVLFGGSLACISILVCAFCCVANALRMRHAAGSVVRTFVAIALALLAVLLIVIVVGVRGELLFRCRTDHGVVVGLDDDDGYDDDGNYVVGSSSGSGGLEPHTWGYCTDLTAFVNDFDVYVTCGDVCALQAPPELGFLFLTLAALTVNMLLMSRVYLATATALERVGKQS